MSFGAKGFSQKRNDPGYFNWLAVADALMFLSDGLRKYAEDKMKELHVLITTNVGGPGVKCTCKCTPGKKPNPHGRTATCIWAQELKKFHHFPRKSDIPWHQSISSQWHDPVDGHREIAKLFMSDLGKNWATTTTTDIGRLLNLLIFCNHFKIQHASLKAVKDWRNKWAHASDLTLSDIDKQNAFKDIECLMNDAELVGIKEVQDCRSSIKKVETAVFSVLQDNESKILEEFRLIQQFQLIQEYKECPKIEEKSEVSEEEIRVPKKFDKLVTVVDKMGSVFLAILLFAISPLSRKVLGMLMFLAYFMFYPVGDRTVISDY
ncbi:Hypothetical predicted protein, partial [Paramuricea clavata]